MKELLYDFYGYNQSIFYAINKFCNGNDLLATLLYISKIFDIENFAVYYVLAATTMLLFHRKQTLSLTNSWIPSYAQMTPKAKMSKYYDFMVKLGTSYACFGLFYAFLKFTINMPRPFCSLPVESFKTIIDTTHERCLSSFPSSHTGLAILIALNIWPHVGLGIRILSIMVIGLVALSRIALAMHYPTDVFYSFFIAYFVFFMSRKIYRLFENNIIKWVKRKLLEA